jgi:hypothetical protein
MMRLITLALALCASIANAQTDNFNRSNETPLASPWGAADGRCGMNLVSHAVGWSTNNQDCVSLYDTYSSAVRIQAVMSTLPSSACNNALYLIFAATEGQAGTTTDYYGARFRIGTAASCGGATSDIDLFRFDNGSFVDISSGDGTYNGGDTPFAINDVFAMFREGNDIVVTQNGTERLRKTDTTYPTAAKVGLGAWTNASTFTGRWDDVAIASSVLLMRRRMEQ